MDEGADVTWVPNGDKLTTTAPGVKFKSYQDEWFGQPVSVLEMDGKVESLDELVSHARAAASGPDASRARDVPRRRH
eukprot:2755950-Prymnesium_polylepis.1